jgi:hypothetical protein
VSRLTSYRDLVRQRARWTKAVKVAKSFHGGELIDYAQSTAIEYAHWLDEHRKAPLRATLEQAADCLMQLQAVQDVLEERYVSE